MKLLLLECKQVAGVNSQVAGHLKSWVGVDIQHGSLTEESIVLELCGVMPIISAWGSKVVFLCDLMYTSLV